MIRHKLTGRLTGAMAGMVLLGLSSHADASMVVYQDTGPIQGSQVSYSQTAFTIADAGTYQATLRDYAFPEPFDKLGLLITTNGTQELGRIDLGPQQTVGSFTFQADPGTYNADLYALAGPTYQLGWYGVSVAMGGSPAPTPLPPSVVLLGTALLALVAAGRRRARVPRVPAVA